MSSGREDDPLRAGEARRVSSLGLVVVEADDGDILREPHAALARDLEHAAGAELARSHEDRVDLARRLGGRHIAVTPSVRESSRE